ncbi:MAG: hypothetical protein ABSE72_12530 [Bacteroidales bacterium]|jgi:hypothetical protein
MKIKTVFFFLSLIIISNFLSGQEFNPGKERWPVKTSVLYFRPVKEITLRELLTLPAPIRKYSNKVKEEYQDQRFPDTVGIHHLREGDIVTTYGYLMLAAVEEDKNREDGDYHVQILINSTWGDSCLVVEATYPPFIKGNKALQDSCNKVRDFFDRHILKGMKKACFGSNGIPAPYVKITGQLFFDAYHMTTPPRGKQNCITKEKMKSYTCWEIHPIMSICFIRKK